MTSTRVTWEGEARLVAGGFNEDTSLMSLDSATLSRTETRIVSNVTHYGWKLHKLDAKTAFLQNEAIVRGVFLKPPAERMTKVSWKLRNCVHGLNYAASARKIL